MCIYTVGIFTVMWIYLKLCLQLYEKKTKIINIFVFITAGIFTVIWIYLQSKKNSEND